MKPEVLHVLALGPLGFLMVADGPTSAIALYGMLFTLIAGLVGRYLDNQRDEKRHEWEQEDRDYQAASIRADLLAHREELTVAIAKVAVKAKSTDDTVHEIKEKQA